MVRFLSNGMVLISSMVGITIISSHVNASPSCYGLDKEGNTIDLSSLCSPSSEVNSLPSVPTNSNIKPENNPVSDNKESSAVSPREEAEKDLQACFSSYTCSQMVGGNNEPQKTPHQVRIEQFLNGGRLKQN